MSFPVTGEPGIDKTALVDEFQRQAKNWAPGLRIALGNVSRVSARALSCRSA
jgi:hypothetical protein